MSASVRIEVPEALAASHRRFNGEAGDAWIAALPALAASFLDRWSLRPQGPVLHGMASLVIPVILPDESPAALKLQMLDEESAGEPAALHVWDGRGAVRLLQYDPATATMLLERLDHNRPLSTVADEREALQILAQLLARLVAFAAPEGLRRLGDIAAAMLEEVPAAVAGVPDRAEQQLLRSCAAAVTDLMDEPGDRLLHWDLHYDNVLAGQREPWLVIDPKPLAGDPGFELLPSMGNRWHDLTATGDVERGVLRRFDLLTDVLGLDRLRATGWTLGRVLQNALWDIGGGGRLEPKQLVIASALLRHRS